jgi:hypothetical protein
LGGGVRGGGRMRGAEGKSAADCGAGWTLGFEGELLFRGEGLPEGGELVGKSFGFLWRG